MDILTLALAKKMSGGGSGGSTANDITYNGTTEYSEGTIGKEVKDLSSQIRQQLQPNYQVTATKGATANTSGSLIPFIAENGDSITASASSTFVNVQLRFYDKDKNYLDYWSLTSALGKSRTFTYNVATTAYFVGITTVDATSPDDYTIVNNSNVYLTRITGIESDISDLDTDISNLGDSVSSVTSQFDFINRFDQSTITTGKYLATTDGGLATHSDFFASDYIDVHDLSSVKCSYTHIVCFYKADKTFISGQGFNTRSADGSISCPTDTYYMRFSTYNDDLSVAQIGEDVDRSNYYSYGKFKMPNLVDSEDTIVVDANGDGDYTSFTLAVKENVDSGAKIKVLAGTYDIVQEYEDIWGTDAVDEMADADSDTFEGFQYGVILRNREIEFAAGSHLVCDWTYKSDGVTARTVDGTHRFCPIRVDYNVKIIGMDLTATGSFYAVHDDYGVSSAYTNEYQNCRVVGTSLYNANCIGGGCKPYSRHIINNCYFDNNLTGSATVRYHNCNSDGAEPEIYVSNCYFNNWFTPRYYGTQTTKMRVYVNNCYATSIHKLAESGSYTTDNVELIKWCNTETDPQ